MRDNPKITPRGFKPGARGAALVLGGLQTEVMEALRREPGLTVNGVEERLRRKREIAHTTVLTTLDRWTRAATCGARSGRRTGRRCTSSTC